MGLVAQSSRNDTDRQTPLRWQLAAFTVIRMIFNTLHRMVYPFLTIFARGLGVDLTTISYALTARSVVGSVGPFAAAVADRQGRRFGMLLGAGLFMLGAAVVVFWPSFPGFTISLVLATLGKYIFDPGMQAYLGDRVPYERRGRTIAISEFGWSLAFVVGVPLMGLLIARSGWMAPFPLLALLGAFIVAGLAWMLPKEAMSADAKRLRDNYRLVLTCLPALTGLAIGMFASAANEQVNLVFGVWLQDSFGLKIAALGVASAVIGISEFGAEGLVAAFVDRLGKLRSISLGLIVNSLAALALPWIGRTELGALAGLFFFYLSFEFTIVSSIPLMTELLPAARATMMAFNVAALSFGRAMGDFLAPRLYGLSFLAVVLGAVFFNLLALLAANRLRKEYI
ncbi:MAG: MFS transporter [Anaerolineales bacterium]